MKIARLITAIAFLLAVQVAFGNNVPGVSVGYPILGETSPAAYCGQNPFFNSGSGGQCTAFCWGRAKEKLGISLPPWGDAQTWYSAAQALYQTGSVAQSNSIAVWSYGDHGHVAFIEEVSGDQVTFNEANTGPNSNYDWGCGYVGAKTWSKAAMAARNLGSSSVTQLLGYIYLNTVKTVLPESAAGYSGTSLYQGVKLEFRVYDTTLSADALKLDAPGEGRYVYAYQAFNVSRSTAIAFVSLQGIEENAVASTSDVDSVVADGGIAPTSRSLNATKTIATYEFANGNLVIGKNSWFLTIRSDGKPKVGTFTFSNDIPLPGDENEVLVPEISSAFGAYSGGDGTAANPYKIATKADLLALAANTADYGKCFILTADIDMGGQVFTTAIIAPDTDNSTSYFEGNVFTGTFDGNAHKITNFSINGGSNSFLGLFGKVNSGTIKNLILENFSITGHWFVGGLVGYSESSTVSNCFSIGAVTGDAVIAGLLGISDGGSISNCYSIITVSGSYGYLGGLVGNIGSNGGSISNCYSTCTINGSNSFCVGGLVGQNCGSINNCYSTGTVSGGSQVGGLVGYNYGSVSNCYSMDAVSSSSNSQGGFAGTHVDGAILGSFWDIQISGQTIGIGNGYSNGLTGKTTAQMKTLSTFTSAGWDFDTIWDIAENTTYPFLRVFGGPNLTIPVYSPKLLQANKGTTLTSIITVTNQSLDQDTFSLSVPKQTVSSNFAGWWAVSFSQNTVTLAPGQSADVLVEIVFGNESSNQITVRATSYSDQDSFKEIVLKALSLDGAKATLFGAVFGFQSIESGHILTFEGPICARLSALSLTQNNVIQVVFDPRAGGDLENAYVKVKDIFEGVVVKEINLPVRFDKRSDEVINSGFDMAVNSYKFSNGEIENNYHCTSVPNKGYCYGFAETSILYFTGELNLPNSKNNASALSLDESLPNIAEYFHHQPILAGEKNDETDYNLLETSIRDGNKPVIIKITGGSSIHAVVAYKITKDTVNNMSYISLYDNNWKYIGGDLLPAFPVLAYDMTKHTFLKYPMLDTYDTPRCDVWEAKPLDIKSEIMIAIRSRVMECVADGSAWIFTAGIDKITKIFQCPVNVQIHDQYGRIIDNQGTNQIPDANFYSIGDEKIFYLPPDLNYTTIIDAYADGNFSYSTITPVETGSPTVAIFEKVPVQNGSQAIFQTQSGMPNASLQLDIEGNGSFDQNVPANISVIHQTVLDYCGDSNGYRANMVTLKANLKLVNGQPDVNRSVYFYLGPQVVSGITDSNGDAAANLLIDQKPGRKLLKVEYAGDPNELSSDDQSTFDILIAGDYDENWILDLKDFSAFASHWSETCSEPDWCQRTDINQSGVVDLMDMFIFMQDWLLQKSPSDLNIDWHVNFHDYASFASHWGVDTCGAPNWCEGTDFDHSGSIDILDLTTFAQYWLEEN